jgi:hypothetical protein
VLEIGMYPRTLRFLRAVRTHLTAARYVLLAALALVTGVLATGAALGLAAHSALDGQEQWTCQCDVAAHWRYSGPSGVAESKAHLLATGHPTTCRRTDHATRVMDRVFNAMFPTPTF